MVRFFKPRLHYQRQLNRLICVLAILVLLLLLKRINGRISNNIIEIIDSSVNYKVDLRQDSRALLDLGKKALQLPIKALEVINLGPTSVYIPPIEGAIYNPFGQVKYLDGSSRFNNGLDIIPKDEKEAVAIDDGVVVDIEDKGSKGYYITIDHKDLTSVYGYLIDVYLTVGDEVSQGSKVGSLGTNKDGNKYLRFEIWEDGQAVNPTKYIKFSKSL